MVTGRLLIDRLFAEMLDQQVIEHGAIFVAFRFAVSVDGSVDAVHQLWAVGQTQLFYQEVLF